MAVREIRACRLCGGADLPKLVDFGDVPLGNNLLEDAASARAAVEYPLELHRCAACGHFQLGHAVAPEILYATNYTYLSGIGPSFIKHFEAYAEWAVAACDLRAGALVVDVGSNDGTCLKAFTARGLAVCGVDPASLAADLANESGIDTFNTFFDDAAVAAIKARHGPADFVTSHNVLAHVDDLAATFANVHNLLKEGGYFAFEVGYFREVLRTGCFDTIYHEHLDYHHADPLVRHLTGLGFSVEDLNINSVQGGSIRLLLRKTGQGDVSAAAQGFLAAERESILNDEAFLGSWRQNIETAMAQFRSLLRRKADAGASIAGYGAPTKATLLMKVAGIGEDDIAYVVEDNPLKTGRFLPSSAVPILPTAELMRAPPDVIVIFAWNFAADIIDKLKGKLGKPVEVVIPLPDLRTVRL
jgi:SAM-dependent methyltransferase